MPPGCLLKDHGCFCEVVCVCVCESLGVASPDGVVAIILRNIINYSYPFM